MEDFYHWPRWGALDEGAIGDDSQGAPTWSPDARALVYANAECYEAESCWIRQIDLASKKVGILPDSQGFRVASWAPNGKYIAALAPERHALMLFEVSRHH